MIEHLSIPISNYKKSVAFYSAALKPMGYRLLRKYPPYAAGFCEGDSTSVWVARQSGKVQPIHIALRGKSKKSVEQFHKEALKAGGRDNGKPGFRRDYGDNYYAAYVLDPDGNNVEACFFGAKAPKQ